MAASQPGAPSTSDLARGAVGFWSGLAIALDSTAPAYSLAAVIGIVVVLAGAQAPAVLLVAFVPMLLTSAAYAALNRDEPDCGTSFAWVRTTFGPWAGWVAGWAVTVTGILVIGSLAEVGATYSLLLVGAEGMAAQRGWVVGGTVLIIAAMTALTVRGTEVSGRVQSALVVIQIGGLLLFAVWALAKGGVADPSLSWLDPTAIPSWTALSLGLLTAVFIYWGWESALSINEETKDGEEVAGRTAVTATVVLLATYVLVAYAVLAWGGTGRAGELEGEIAILGDYAGEVLPGALDKLVLLAVAVSGLASAQTTILPGSRTTLSMARRGALPAAFARIHPRFQTPHVGTVAVAALAVAYYVPFKLLSEDYLLDTITALGMLIAFSYAATGFACAWRFRDRPRTWVGPLVGASALTFLFVKAVQEFEGGPRLIGFGLLAAGGLLALRLRA